MDEGVKGWLGFLVVLIVRGGIMTLTGWVVVKLVREAWHSSVALGLALGLLFILGVGLLYTIIERWP